MRQQTAEIQTHMQSLQSYELQLSNLTHSLAKYDAALRQAQDEKVGTGFGRLWTCLTSCMPAAIV